ncbi:MAG: VWA domain-containing protein [Acidobacteriota bacterium]|nr:VWA domain-containing protein [Acidobacteriota bacterium]
MKYRYTRYTGEELDVDIEELVSKLSRLLLESGFGSGAADPDDPYADDDHRSEQALRDAMLEALLSGGLLSDEKVSQLLGDPADGESLSQLDELLDRLIQQMAQQGYITRHPDLDTERQQRQGPGGGDEDSASMRFEVTDKGLDFLGYRALRDLLGSVGHSSVGRHDTRDLATGVEASGAPKPYEFGDTMNLDASATILNAVRRTGSSAVGSQGVDVDYPDLMVAQGEYHSACATVLMLDCSHSMILYGEDRFTPAKQVALALSNLIRHQYPGDTLRVVLFHDSAEEIPLGQLARARVGPYYTNTREGLRLARRLLERQPREMRQIVMITDGKPSALTCDDGRIYRNAFGLDPWVISETFTEVANCRKAGILINTFMLARDYELVSFVKRVTSICHGKAYFTTPHTLGRYVLMDFLDKKTRTVH